MAWRGMEKQEASTIRRFPSARTYSAATLRSQWLPRYVAAAVVLLIILLWLGWADGSGWAQRSAARMTPRR